MSDDLPKVAYKPPAEGGGITPPAAENLIWKGSPKWQADFGFFFISTLILAGGVGLWVVIGGMIGMLVGLGLALTGILMMVGIRIKRRHEHYKLTNMSVEYQRGVFSTSIDNLELWRVNDIGFHQNLFDKMLGVSKIKLFTQDESHPELWLIGLPPGRKIYDELKKGVHIARQARNVVGMTS